MLSPITVSIFSLGYTLCSSNAFVPSAHIASRIQTTATTILQPQSFISTPTKHNHNIASLNTALHANAMNKGIELSGLLYDSTSTAFEAWEWTANLGAPAALVAGAVLVTLSETRASMIPHKNDMPKMRILKKCCRLLLLSSFALEVVCIFVGTCTGSVLLGHGGNLAKKIGYSSPLGLLHHHHEFEYLTIQISFLQGLFNWLAAVVIENLIPQENETKGARLMNKCISSWLVSLIFWIMAFYNNHLNFYSDYATMLWRYSFLFVKKYVTCWPLRPMSLLYIPSIIVSTLFTFVAFTNPDDQDSEKAC